MSKATIDDVAALAGVSIKTVSRVFNNEPNVSLAMREKVAAAIEQLDYRPNMSARSLAANRSYLLGLLCGRPSAHYVMGIQEGVLDVARPQGYEVIVHPCEHTDANLIQDVTNLIRNKRIDGVMVTPPMSDNLELLKAIAALGIPLVRVAPTKSKTLSPYVETNDLEASYDMTCQLISLGHKRIGFICGDPDHYAMALRFEGYKMALLENDIALDDALVVEGDNLFESGEMNGQKLLSVQWRPTAIFAANDDMAAGVLMVAHQLGFKIPVDLSVVGFDDAPVAKHIWPGLTTVRQPIKEMAQKATELLIKQLKGKSVQLPASMLSSSIVMRKSTGIAPE